MNVDQVRQLLRDGYVFFFCPIEMAQDIAHAAGLSKHDMKLLTHPLPIMALRSNPQLGLVLGIYPDEWAITRAVIIGFYEEGVMIITISTDDVDAGAEVVHHIANNVAELLKSITTPARVKEARRKSKREAGEPRAV